MIKTEDMFSELETYDVPTPEELEARRQEMMAVMQEEKMPGYHRKGRKGKNPRRKKQTKMKKKGKKA